MVNTVLMEMGSAMPRARSYQLEMLQHSLQGNIIVAMDTGSGKTQIAILRIMEELDRCSQDQLVWFLAPTVALCTQQHEVLRSQLLAARTRLLIGADNVDRWSDKRLWDSVLSGVQIVVSTHDVLLDALGHGFVQITRLALLVFDEAHHCRRKHPANRIMKDFYHPRKSSHGPTSVPHILGLTASPVLKSGGRDLGVIEANLDSICRTPRLQRAEMKQFVHRPVMKKLLYHGPPGESGAVAGTSADSDTYVPQSTALRLLKRICQTIVPKFKSPTATGTRTATAALATAAATTTAPGPDQPSIGESAPPRSGYEEQLIKFKTKANHVYQELGAWAADYFILESIRTLRESLDDDSPLLFGFRDDEKMKLIRTLNAIPAKMSTTRFQGAKIETEAGDGNGNGILISAKVERLISFLAKQDPETCSGLIFVKQRAVVSVLHALLSRHPQTASRFRCATFVGMSNSAQRRYSMAELMDTSAKIQGESLTELKAQVKNIIIATDVLEEGIDVTACNLVVCFDVPANLKSFLQRRGRARKEKSTFAILLSDNGDDPDKIPAWQQLEEDMIRLYQDETRSLDHDQEEEEDVTFQLNVPSTGAKLTADAALGHLHHFCALLPPQPYVDLRPAFAIREESPTGRFSATVTLPNCVNASVRCATSRQTWETEKAAMKDAAFQAYQALFQAGLLNDHLLPLKHDAAALDNNGKDAVDNDLDLELPAVVEVRGQFDPWLELADAWSGPVSDLELHYIDITCTLQQPEDDGKGFGGRNRGCSRDKVEFRLITPACLRLPAAGMAPIKMYWSEGVTFILTLSRARKMACPNPETLEAMREITKLIQRSVHSDLNPDRGNAFVALFTPSIEPQHLLQWLETNAGRRSALDHVRAASTAGRLQPSPVPIPFSGFVRSPSSDGRPCIFQRWCVQDQDTAEQQQKQQHPMKLTASLITELELELECVPLPRRRNFLLPGTLSQDTSKGLSLAHLKISDGEATASDNTKNASNNNNSNNKIERFSAQDATVDRLPIEQARFGLFIPGLLQHIEVNLVAQRLCATVLQAVPFTDIGPVITAISCPSAQWTTNYQRLEFIGDSVLKFVVSHQLYVDHPSWHEGYLSRARAKLTSNNTLARAATRTGLDRFIMAEPERRQRNASTKSGRALRVSAVEGNPDANYSESAEKRNRETADAKRNLSSKTLADVVEALLGAAYVQGGFPLARTCMNVFLPELHLEPEPGLGVEVGSLEPVTPAVGTSENLSSGSGSGNHGTHSTETSSFIVKAETMIGYQFQHKPLLLEALTHPTCERDLQTESYQRLEFLGDAVLDMLVVSVLAEPQNAHDAFVPSQGEMTRIKAAMVNGNLLGFFCLEFSMDEEVIDVVEEEQQQHKRPLPAAVKHTGGGGKDSKGRPVCDRSSSSGFSSGFGRDFGRDFGPAPGFRTTVRHEQRHLWQYMRSHHREVISACKANVARYEQFGSAIRTALATGRSYPWVPLTGLEPDKFFSDLIESVIGAIFVDSRGDLKSCQRFIERIGLTAYLRRVCGDGVDVEHPRNALERISGSDKVHYLVGCKKEGEGESHGDDNDNDNDNDLGQSELYSHSHNHNYTYHCTVSVNEEPIAHVAGCRTRDEAMAVAAETAKGRIVDRGKKVQQCQRRA